MKTCFKCGTVKPLNDFYRHPKMADGRLGKCKSCTKSDIAENYRKRHGQYLAYEKSPQRADSRKRRALENLRRHRAKYVDKFRARSAVSNALRSGRLVKFPCEVCGEHKVEAHHDDYARPLEVRWLCHLHHRALEGRLIECAK